MATAPPDHDVTDLLLAWRQVGGDVPDRLFSSVYQELRRIAHRQLFGGVKGRAWLHQALGGDG